MHWERHVNCLLTVTCATLDQTKTLQPEQLCHTSFCSLWMSAAASEAERVSSSMLATTLPSRSSLSSGVTCTRAQPDQPPQSASFEMPA